MAALIPEVVDVLVKTCFAFDKRSRLSSWTSNAIYSWWSPIGREDLEACWWKCSFFRSSFWTCCTSWWTTGTWFFAPAITSPSSSPPSPSAWCNSLPVRRSPRRVRMRPSQILVVEPTVHWSDNPSKKRACFFKSRRWIGHSPKVRLS